MGQAKQRRNKFGEPARSPVAYHRARWFLVLDHYRDAWQEAAIEACCLDYPATYYDPSPARRAQQDIAAVLKGIDVPPGSIVLVDPRTLLPAATVSEEEFFEGYFDVPGFEWVACEVEEELFEVALTEDDAFVLAGSGRLDDPLDFMRDMVRFDGDRCMPCAWPFSMQLAGVMLSNADPAKPMHLIDHVLHQQLALRPLLADLSSAVNADAGVAEAFLRGSNPFEDEEGSSHPLAAMLDLVSGREDPGGLPKVLRDFCRHEEEGHDVLRPRHRDDPDIWEDFQDDVLRVGAALGIEIVIGEDAWRGSYEIGAVLAAGRRDLHDRFLRFFDRGTVVGHVSPNPSARFDVIDIEDMRFVVKTVHGVLVEFVAWGRDQIEARSPTLDDENERPWAGYRFVPQDMSRPERMRIEVLTHMAMSGSQARLLVANLHGFDAWSDLVAAATRGPASPFDEDIPAEEVELRQHHRSERVKDKMGLAAFEIWHVADHLKVSARRGAPSLADYEPGRAIFSPADIADGTRRVMDDLGFTGSEREFEDAMRTARAVHPSAWCDLLQRIGWRLVDIDPSAEGRVIGPTAVRFATAVAGDGRRFEMHLVAFSSPPGDEADPLLEEIEERIEDDGRPAILLQNAGMFGRNGNGTVLYGGQAWDGEAWWHFCLRPGNGLDDAIAQKGMDVDLLSKKVTRQLDYAGAEDEAVALQFKCGGHHEGDDLSLMVMKRGKHGWESPVFIPTDAMEQLAGMQI